MADLIRQWNIFFRASFSRDSRNRLFESIWESYHGKIAVFVRSIVKNRHSETADITQDIMVKVYNNLHTYNPVYSFSTWIYRIARNHCLDILNKKSPAARSVSIDLPDGAFDIKDTAAGQDFRLISKEQNDLIRAYLETLNETDRQISFLRFYEGMKYIHIGSILNIPEGTVKYQVHTIRSGLKQYLEQYNES
ncbi:RNA polymerase sigma factor [candidate division KSB1 bacterium]